MTSDIINTEQPKKQVTVKDFLYSDKRQFMLAFGNNEKAVNKYLLGVCNTLAANKDLLKCTHESIRDAAVTSAVLDVPLDARQYAWLVPYGNKVQFQLSYKGYVYIAKRDIDVDNINSVLVYDGDDFKFDIGENTINHIPDLDHDGYGSGDNIKFAYAKVTFKDGTGRAPIYEVMTRKQIDAIKSGAKQAYIWNSHYGEMARKTVIKRLCKHAQLGDVATYDQIDNSIENGSIINVTPEKEIIVDNKDFDLKEKIISELKEATTCEGLKETNDKYGEQLQEFSMYNLAYSKEIEGTRKKLDASLYIGAITEKLEECEDLESLDAVYNAHSERINRLSAKNRDSVLGVYCEKKEALTLRQMGDI